MDKFNTNQQKSDKEKASVNDNSLKVTLSLQENGKKFSQESPKKMTISDFLLIKNLGKGSYGKVLMAKHALSNKCYAIKVIDKAFIEIEEKVHEVHIERIILTKFNHPNIIKLYYTFHNSKKLYFVLELAEKGDLKHFIKSAKTLNYDLAKFFTAEIVNALEYIHKKGIIHRDLKPENILLTERLHVKICDFSTAACYGKYFDRKERKFKDGEEKYNIEDNLTDLIGTAEYISPEMIQNGKSYFSSDLWALGIMLYQFFHGTTPFLGSTQKNTVQNILSKNCSEISQYIPEDAQDLIRKLIVYEPEKRLGAGVSDKSNGYDALKNHKFFEGIDFENLYKIDPPHKNDDSLQYVGSSCDSPMNSSFSSAYGDTSELVNLTNFKLSFENEEEKIKDIKSDLEHKKFINNTKKFSDVFIKDKKSLFFSQREIEEDSNKIEEDTSLKNENIILYEDVLEKKSSLVIYEKIKLVLYRDRLKFFGISNNIKSGEILLDKKVEAKVRDENKFTIIANNTIYYFRSDKGCSKDWCDRINGVIEII